jgi:hypothetical protein
MLRDALANKLDEEACVIEHKTARIAEVLGPDTYQRSSELWARR